MNIGKQIAAIRKEQQMTQEEFGKLFHQTLQRRGVIPHGWCSSLLPGD